MRNKKNYWGLRIGLYPLSQNNFKNLNNILNYDLINKVILI